MHKERKDGKSPVFCFVAVGGVKDFSHIYGKSTMLLGQRKEFLLGWLITITQPFHITRIIQRTNTPQKKKCLVGFLFQVITNNDKICDIICTIRNPFSHFGTLRLALDGNNGYKKSRGLVSTSCALNSAVVWDKGNAEIKRHKQLQQMLLSLQRHKGCEEPRGQRDVTSQRQETGTGVRDNRRKQMQIWVKHTKPTIFLAFMLTKEKATLLIFLAKPNCLCQLFMVDGFEGRVGGYAPPITIVKLVGGQNTLHHIAIFLLWSILCTSSIRPPLTIVPPLLPLYPRGSKYAAVLCSLLPPCNASYPPDRKHTNRKSQFDWTKM